MRAMPTSLLAAGLVAVSLLPLSGGSLSSEPLPSHPAHADGEEAASATVIITYNAKSKRISVSPDPVPVKRGQRVDWSPGSSIVAWAVDIPSPKEPFGASVRANGVRGGKGVAAGARVRANATPGTYKYTVAIWDGTEVRILDPEIVVNN